MKPDFDKLHRQLGSGTAVTFIATLVFFGLALLAALLGFPDAVESFKSAAAAVAYVFAGLLVLFLVTSLAAAGLRWLEQRRAQPGN